MEFEERLKRANERLKASKVGVQIQQRGGRLALQATFPPKPGSDKTRPYQQQLALGVHAHPIGLQQAEKDARLVGAQLDTDKFDWNDYLKGSNPESIGDW